MTIEEAYATLGLQAGASFEEVRKAYREKARQSHPDMGGDAETFIRVQAAYELLCVFMGQTREESEVPIPPELRAVIDQIIREFHQETARQLSVFASAMEAFYRGITHLIMTLSRKKLSKFNNYFRREWNGTVKAIFKRVNRSNEQMFNNYERWFDDSVTDLHKEIQEERFSYYIRSPKLALQGLIPLIIGIILAIALHSRAGLIVLLVGLVMSVLFALILVANSYLKRYRKPRTVECLDLAIFKVGRNEIMSISSEVLRSDIQVGRVAGAGGAVAGSMLTKGLAGPLVGGLIGWGASTIISHIQHPTPVMRQGILVEFEAFMQLATPALQAYIIQTQQDVLHNLKDTIIRNYRTRVKKMAHMLADPSYGQRILPPSS